MGGAEEVVREGRKAIQGNEVWGGKGSRREGVKDGVDR